MDDNKQHIEQERLARLQQTRHQSSQEQAKSAGRTAAPATASPAGRGTAPAASLKNRPQRDRGVRQQPPAARQKKEQEDGSLSIGAGMGFLFEGLLLASALFFFFDLPQIALSLVGIGFLVNWLISAIGWLIVFIWLKIKGYSLFDAYGIWKSFFLFSAIDFGTVIAPTISLFVFYITITTVAKPLLNRIPGAGKLAKS